MILGLGLYTVAGMAGAVFYIVHHILVKTSLFLVAGLVERSGGSSRLSAVGGFVRRAPGVTLLFALPALSLAGLPPFSGFVAKFALVDAGIAERQWVVVVVAVAVGALTLFSMTKIWAGVFWGEHEDDDGPPFDADLRMPGSRVMVWSTAALVATSLAVVAAAGPLWALSERAAVDLLSPSTYIELVLGSRR
jgi:multicomponent Na+:H+ antiporter subunit D